MKYSEFTKILNDHGYVVENLPYDLYVVSPLSGNRLMCIDKEDNHAICTDYVEFLERTNEEKDFLLGIGIDLAKTPLAEREEEKRYWLQRIEPPILGEQDPRYLFYTRVGGYYDIGTTKSEWRNVIKTIFTESEIAEMDITGFQKVEVLK